MNDHPNGRMSGRTGKVETAFKFLGGITVFLLFLSAMFSLSFFLTDFIYQQTGNEPTPYLRQILNSMLGIFFTIIIILLISARNRSRQWTMLYQPIIDALGQIAKGNFSVRVDPILDDNGLITELSNSVNNMALELNQMEKMRQEFISNVSHEIQSPLTSIRGFAGVLQNDSLAVEERHQYLSIIETESTRLSRITENLLKLASLESEQVKFDPKPYRLDRQIRNLILVCEPQWADKTIDMEVSLEEVEASADEDLLSQVWINLIHNSIKFTPSGGKICVALRRCENNVEFKIADTGMGIAEADQAHIFERFYKADKSRTHSNGTPSHTNGGSGLGLSIVQKVVDMHKGSITLESQVGVGTTFTVTLPA